MTTHGKYCDFDFYVTSLDAENGCAATEPMSSGLSLLEAVSEGTHIHSVYQQIR